MSTIRSWRERSYRRRLLDEDLERLGTWNFARILEIGAGRLRRRGWFRPVISGRWTTVDREIGVCPHAVGDAGSLPFASSSWDAVVCLEVVEYVDAPDRVLAEVARVLVPNGRLIVSMPFLHRWDAPNDLWRVTPAGLSRLLERSGFAVLQLLTQGGAYATIANMVRDLAVHSAPPLLRGVAFYAALPLCEALLQVDRRAIGGRTRSFSTGFLAVAEKR